jgi:hypothetical protein
MGCTGSKTEDEKEQERKNREAERELKDRKKEIMSEIKLLLLGKSNFWKIFYLQNGEFWTPHLRFLDLLPHRV